MDKKYIDLTKYDCLRMIRVEKNHITIVTRKSVNDGYDYEKIPIADVLDCYFIINHNHVISAYGPNIPLEYMFGNTGAEYSVSDIRSKYSSFVANCSGANGISRVWRILKENELSDFIMAEIGVQYGSTAQSVIDNLKVSRYDMFENIHTNLLHQRFQDYEFVNIIDGDATDRLNDLDDVIYDAVFFDCTHKYDSDIKILENLIKHLDSHSIVIFHDYDMDSVRKAIEEFCMMFDGTVYALSDKQGTLKLK